MGHRSHPSWATFIHKISWKALTVRVVKSHRSRQEGNDEIWIFDARGIFQKGLSVRQSLPLQICEMKKDTREKVHILSAREISIFLCVEMAMSLKKSWT